MVSSSTSSKILIGISLDPNESKDLLSWAIAILAHPNDDIVAVHILVGKDKKKYEVSREFQSRLRRAKAFVISVLGEFAKTCQFKQVNLEARVGFSSKIGRGLIKEANSVSADYLIIGGSRNRSNRPTSIARYCLRNSPNGCTLVVFGKCMPPPQQKIVRSSSRWNKSNKAISPAEKAESKSKNSSPRTVLDEIEVEYQSTEDETLSCGDSSITYSTSVSPNFTKKSKQRKQSFSPCRLVFSFLGSPFRRRRNNMKEIKKPLLKCFSYEEIMKATNNFNPDNIVGRGGYSEVYRGDVCDGETIAVKRLAKDNKDAKKEKEFLMELGIIGHVCHPNTASLVGYCIENGLHLIFSFSQNGTLASALYKIAIGVARGLHYLHKCCKHRIIHRDIKASNVLLGPDYEPQITDFGLAKWLPNKWTHHAVIPIEGTFGYLAPEYFMHGIVDEKTDVFAFGVLLMEIVTGRRPVDSSRRNLLIWAKPLMESGDIASLADPMMEGKYDSEQLHRLVLTASYCVRQSSIWRPSMNEFTSDELDDYSMVYGYDIPTDQILEDSLSLSM
ncbi:hypothetical protein G4B88_012085 [Cannabis sativa]|uniref:Protein kinase domain-containing protein n=1 Tax=Cannabis sativa TaxID=3483 RepID=A0A7J6DQZ6_CANSA|nr:hypothetical protein G4B88_012085 [Cannabis sativa]